jgi:hypothetical protein
MIISQDALERSTSETNLYIKSEGMELVIVIVYVYNLIIRESEET